MGTCELIFRGEFSIKSSFFYAKSSHIKNCFVRYRYWRAQREHKDDGRKRENQESYNSVRAVHFLMAFSAVMARLTLSQP